MQVDIKQLYNPVPRRVELVGVGEMKFELQFEPVRTSSQQRAGPSGHPVEQTRKMRKKCCERQRNLGSVCCSLFSLQLTSHTQPFRNPFATLSQPFRIKYERYVLLKKCVRSSLLLIMFPHVYVYV